MKLSPGFIAATLLCLSATAISIPASAEEVTQPAPAAATANVRHGNVVWRGEVDGTVDISLRHRTVRAILHTIAELETMVRDVPAPAPSIKRVS